MSHSRVECFKDCRKKFKNKYIDKLITIPNTDDNNALYLGTALHTGIEKGFAAAKQEYLSHYPILTQGQLEELDKLEPKIELIMDRIPKDAQFEIPIHSKHFIGFIDMLTPNDDGSFDLYDFKYTNNVNRYRTSSQLHLYKYYFERTTGKRIDHLYYLIVPKKESHPVQLEIEYDPTYVIRFLEDAKSLLENTEYPKEGKFCRWCEYYENCFKGEDYMILPSVERRDISKNDKKKLWLYGAPFSGKTTVVDGAPNPLNLNTDGNVSYVTMPVLPINDEVKQVGRITERKFAWTVFKEAVEELEKNDNQFETIVIDLLEDVYESCRLYMYDKLNITHESDDSFRAWEKVRQEFLGVMKRFFNLEYKNLVILSHEDKSRDLTKKSGEKITTIRPNLQEKIANKLAGMVDITARVVMTEGEKRYIEFKPDETVFGGGRLNYTKETRVPLSWESIEKTFKEAREHSGEVKSETVRRSRVRNEE